MRKRDKTLLWPAYFDSSKTRLQGRRVPKNLAIVSPKLEEIQNATKSVGLPSEVVLEVKYPKAPWQKTGYIVIPKKSSKTKIISLAKNRLHRNSQKKLKNQNNTQNRRETGKPAQVNANLT